LHLPCPNCGADVVFRSPALPSRVCDYCRAMLVRSDAGVAQVGLAAALPFDVSPVQIGMRGRIDGYAFDVIGRVRWGWTDGTWNEWLMLFEDGAHAWLGEAMGDFMLLRPRPFGPVRTHTLKGIAGGKDAVPGTEIKLDGAEMIIVDAREVQCITAEGELPFVPKPGWRVYSVDIRGENGEIANLQREGDAVEFYVGRYVTLAELAPSGLRAIEGWALPAYAC
jgi:hypothetical protein